MDEIFEELRSGFGLSDKHIIILENLYKQELDANQICKTTGIPHGRIYAYLNELVDLKLIEKSEKKPYKYGMKDSDQKIMKFLKYKFDNLVGRQQKVVDLLERKSTIQDLEIIHSGDEYAFKVIQLIDEEKFIKTVIRHGSIPFPLYPERIKDFLRVRKVIVTHRQTMAHTSPSTTSMLYRAHIDAYQQGKKFYAIVERSALDYNFKIIEQYLGKQFLKAMINEMKEKIKKYDMKIYVVDEYIPMQIFVTRRKVMLSIIHYGVTTGTIIQSDRLVTLYNNFFDDMVERGEPITKYLDSFEI